MELILKIDDVSGNKSYKDGDIVQAFSNDRILMCHAEMKCHVNNFPLDDITGLRPNDGLLMKFIEKTSKFKFVRVSNTEVKKINIGTLVETTIGASPNGDGESIDLHSFLTDRFKNPKHLIFGQSDAEIWYTGRRSFDINAIWNDIETHTSHLKVDHFSWPLSDLEKRRFYPMNCRGNAGGVIQEISSGTVSERHENAIDVVNIIVAKRKWQVPYWDLSGVNIDDIRNKDKMVDGRVDMGDRPFIDNINVDKIAAGIITL
jgi:hypothetical protein